MFIWHDGIRRHVPADAQDFVEMEHCQRRNEYAKYCRDKFGGHLWSQREFTMNTRVQSWSNKF